MWQKGPGFSSVGGSTKTGKRNKRFDCVNEKKKLNTSFKADTAIFYD